MFVNFNAEVAVFHLTDENVSSVVAKLRIILSQSLFRIADQLTFEPFRKFWIQ